MKILLVLVVAVVLALAALWWLPLLHGYVLIRTGGWIVEMNLLVLIAALLSIYLLLRSIHWAWNLPGNSLRRYFERRARKQLEVGMLALSEGDFRKAEKALAHSAKHESTATVSYLGAAQAASHHGDSDRSQAYLDKAQDTAHSHASLAVTRAELLLVSGQIEQALGELEGIAKARENRPKVLELLVHCYRKLQRWDELARLGPELVRAKIIEAAEAERIRRHAEQAQLTRADSIDQLQQRWRALPRKSRKDRLMLICYAQRALALGHGEAAEATVADALRAQWSDELALLYSQLPGGDPTQRTRQGEQWLKQQPDSAAAHLLLARRCRQAKLWAKAAEYYQASLKQKPLPEAWRELAEVQITLDQTEAALDSLRRAFDQRGDVNRP